jgi:hypothetical protein
LFFLLYPYVAQSNSIETQCTLHTGHPHHILNLNDTQTRKQQQETSYSTYETLGIIKCKCTKKVKNTKIYRSYRNSEMRCVKDNTHQTSSEDGDNGNGHDPAYVNPENGTPVRCTPVTVANRHTNSGTGDTHSGLKGGWLTYTK